MKSILPILLVAAACLRGQDEVRSPVTFADAFPAQEDFDRPVFLDHHRADPDHYWVVEQTGRVFRVPRDGAQSERHLALDWSDVSLHPRNGGHNEEGLLGFAFDPGFGDTNSHVFLYYSHRRGGSDRNPDRESVISRFDVAAAESGPVIDPQSELVVMRIDQPWGNHNGGTIVFGPDGMLYVALGDGGAADDRGKNGQNLGTLLATILRIDVRDATAAEPYRVPDDNPFVGRDEARPEIWAYGLRNPWRIAFDRETGDLWCGDVGQNTWEEVDRIVRGGNYGWPILEGTHGFPAGTERSAEEREGLIPPIAEYPRSQGISVTGGYVYRGAAIPELRGRYVYGDWALMNVWAVREDRDGLAHDVLELGRGPGPLSSFAEEPDGELLLLCGDGRIRRMLPATD